MTAPVSAASWSTAIPDWKDRIREGRSMVPDLPVHDAVAEKALRIFKRLRVRDIIGTPTYFPLRSGGTGLAGEAGPEAIMPLARGPDGRLGVAASGGGRGASIIVNIATPDAESFRRSELYVTGQIARAVARGQRGM